MLEGRRWVVWGLLGDCAGLPPAAVRGQSEGRVYVRSGRDGKVGDDE